MKSKFLSSAMAWITLQVSMGAAEVIPESKRGTTHRLSYSILFDSILWGGGGKDDRIMNIVGRTKLQFKQTMTR